MDNPYAPPPRDGSGPAKRPEAPRDPDARAPEPARQRQPLAPAPQRPTTPPDPEEVARAARRIQHFAALGLATLLTVSLPLPWSLAAPVFAVAAMVVGFRAILAARRVRVRGAVVVGIGAGVGVAGAVVAMFASVIAFWPLQLDLQRCQHEALTISAQHACTAAFEQGVQDRLERLTGVPAP